MKAYKVRTVEDKDQVERYRTTQDNDDNGHHETREGDKISRYHQNTEEDGERGKSQRFESGHRRQETEDGYRYRENFSRRCYRQDDESSEKQRETIRRRDKKGDDDKQGWYKSEEASGSVRGESKQDGKMLESSKPHVQSTKQETNNADASILGKSGGIYIPPFKLARMMNEVQDKKQR